MKARRITIEHVPSGDTERLDERLSHYLSRVLRLEAGAPVDLVDMEGSRWRGTLGFEGSQAIVHGLVRTADADTPAALIVVAALIKQGPWEWMLEKATELGATRIIPWAADRSVIRLDSKRGDSKQERWQRICDSAVRQSERTHRIQMDAPQDFVTTLKSLASAGHTLIHFDETQPETPWPDFEASAPLALITGPEGGFTEREREWLAEAGAMAVGLGPSLLKAETATIAGLTAIRFRRHGLLT